MAQIDLLNFTLTQGNDNFQQTDLQLSGGFYLRDTYKISLLLDKKISLFHIAEASLLPSGVHFNSKYMNKMKDYWHWSEYNSFSSFSWLLLNKPSTCLDKKEIQFKSPRYLSNQSTCSKGQSPVSVSAINISVNGKYRILLIVVSIGTVNSVFLTSRSLSCLTPLILLYFFPLKKKKKRLSELFLLSHQFCLFTTPNKGLLLEWDVPSVFLSLLIA